MDYYGTRRKRNIDLSHIRQKNVVEQEDMEDEVELEEGYEYEELGWETEGVEPEMDQTQRQSPSDFSNDASSAYINGKPFIPKQPPKKETFADTHIRITTYLEKNVHQIIRMLQKQGHIASITQFINDSIKEHLLNQYHDPNAN